MKQFVILTTGLMLALAACSDSSLSNLKEAWNSANDPFHFSPAFERRMEALPKSGRLDVQPWTDTYWPSREGGIANRWQSSASAFTYQSPSRDQLQQMSSSEIARLSPAEKYDIYVGRYDYPTVRSERARTNPNAASWEGLCHGWAPAAVLYTEPRPVTLTNSDGVQIPFGSADVKALLTYHQGQLSNGRTYFVGQRCDADLGSNPGYGSSPECRDANAGAFHIVLTNQIARFKKSFMVDVTRDMEVWNQPVYSYRSQVTGSNGPSVGAAPGTVIEYTISTELFYGMEAQPTWEAWGNAQNIGSKVYTYRVEVDGAGSIIGGEWLSSQRPDFMWIQERSPFSGYFSSVEEIYQASANGVTPPPTYPTARPTTAPTPRPTVVPTVRPTVVPTPIRTPDPVIPVPGIIPGQTFCPAGTKAVAVGGGYGCLESNGIRIVAGATPSMMQACSSQYMAGYCKSERWPLEVFKQFRGSGRCPSGSNWNGSVCMDGSGAAYGPFDGAHVQSCLNSGFGSSCYKQVWSATITNNLF